MCCACMHLELSLDKILHYYDYRNTEIIINIDLVTHCDLAHSEWSACHRAIVCSPCHTAH